MSKIEKFLKAVWYWHAPLIMVTIIVITALLFSLYGEGK